jgi:hypothetical protein
VTAPGAGPDEPPIGALTALPDLAKGELFELELYGGPSERRYRAMRPEIAAMPWGTLAESLASSPIPAEERVLAQRAWTGAAFQEHRTAVACTATLRALLEARAPVDLVGLATRFPLDEMAHVELCSRMTLELGGATEIRYVPTEVVRDPASDLSSLMRAADMVVRFFCVGEALSIPLLRGAAHAARHPLARAVLSRIVRDEAAHGVFGFTFLDWAEPLLTDEDRAHLGRAADRTIVATKAQWASIAEMPKNESEHDALAWMRSDAYLSLARRAMSRGVVEPLRRRGIPVAAWGPEDAAG